MRCSGRAFRRGAWRGAPMWRPGVAFRAVTWYDIPGWGLVRRSGVASRQGVSGCDLAGRFGAGACSGMDVPDCDLGIALRHGLPFAPSLCGLPGGARSLPADSAERRSQPQKELPQNTCAKRIMQKTSLKRKREPLLLRLVVLLGSVFCAGGCWNPVLQPSLFLFQAEVPPVLFTEYTRSSCARRSDSTRTACHSTGPR